MEGEAGEREVARASEPLFGVEISPGDAESLWSMELPPDPSSGCARRAQTAKKAAPKKQKAAKKKATVKKK